MRSRSVPQPKTPTLREAGRSARRLLTFTIRRRTVWITGFGFGAAFMALLIGGAAFNTGTNLLYVMLSLIFALFTLSVVFGWLNLNGLRVSRIAPVEAYVGRPAEFQVVVKNSKRWLGSFGIAVEEPAADILPEGIAAFFLSAPAGGTAVAQASVKFRRRGLYRLEGVRLGTMFPFGLLEFRARQADPLELIVYPELVPVGRAPRRLVRGAGEEEHPEKGHASGLYGIREYQLGDPARDIHWRLSAKGTGLKLREYESESAQGVQLVLDLGREDIRTAMDHERLEKAISLTASLARHYLEAGIDVMVWTAAGVVPRGAGPAHLRRILRSLALLNAEDMKAEAAVPPTPPEMTQLRIRSGTLGEPDGAGEAAKEAGAGMADRARGAMAAGRSA